MLYLDKTGEILTMELILNISIFILKAERGIYIKTQSAKIFKIFE